MKRKPNWTEDLDDGKEIWRSAFEPYVPSSREDLGYVSYYPPPETSDLTTRPTQTKNPGPPTFNVSSRIRHVSDLNDSRLFRNSVLAVWSKVLGGLFWTAYIRR